LTEHANGEINKALLPKHENLKSRFGPTENIYLVFQALVWTVSHVQSVLLATKVMMSLDD